jgi:hypothetical protein
MTSRTMLAKLNQIAPPPTQADEWRALSEQDRLEFHMHNAGEMLGLCGGNLPDEVRAACLQIITPDAWEHQRWSYGVCIVPGFLGNDEDGWTSTAACWRTYDDWCEKLLKCAS